MSRGMPVLDRESHQLLDCAGEGVAIVQNGIITWVNTSLLASIASAECDVVGRSFVELIHPDDRTMVSERHAMRLLGQNVPSSYGFRILDKEGCCRFVEVNAAMVSMEGSPATVCFLTDVTERQKAIQALKQSEEGYRHLFHSTQDGLEVIDAETGMIILANDAAARILGFASAEQMSGISPLEHVFPEDRGRVSDTIAACVAEKDPHWLMDLKLRGNEGRLTWVSAIMVKIEYQQRPACLVSMRDVTERRRMEQALRESERHYRMLADNMSDVIWVADPSLNPTYISSSIARLTGYTVSELMAQNYEHLITPGSLASAKTAFSEVFASENDRNFSIPRRLPLELVRKDGTVIYVESTMCIIYDDSGRPMEIMGVLHDVSETRAMEERLRESFKQLERTVEGTIRAISLIVEKRDCFTAGHQRRTSELSQAIARQMNLTEARVQVVRIAALLHDIGKIGVPSEILSKPGRLSEVEFAMIRTHCQVGYDILKTVDFPWPIADIVRQHHERLNGSGYPLGLKDQELLLEAKILAVADVVEAMTSHRPYRPAPGIERALEEISRNNGVLYDPGVAAACLEVFRTGRTVFETDAPQPDWVAV